MAVPSALAKPSQSSGPTDSSFAQITPGSGSRLAPCLVDLQRGKNSVCVVGLDSITFCHLGDLGQPLSSSQVSEIGFVDVLFLPVGGFYTIGPEQGRKVMESMQPKIVVPMHYRLAGMSSPFNALSTVEDFLRRDDNVEKLDGPAFTVSKSDLPEKMQIVIPKLL